MKKSFFVFAMKRSGHHALVNWISRNLGDCIHLNNVSARENSSVKDWRSSETRVFGSDKSKNLVANFEDFEFRQFKKLRWPQNQPVFHILFMRDFPNWLASSYKRKDWATGRIPFEYLTKERGKMPSRIEIYREHSQMFISNDPRFIFVSYNQFLTDFEYRNRLAQKLGFRNVLGESKLMEVSEFGSGSSFTAMKERDIKTEDVFTRYKKYADDREFQTLIENNQDLVRFSQETLHQSSAS